MGITLRDLAVSLQTDENNASFIKFHKTTRVFPTMWHIRNSLKTVAVVADPAVDYGALAPLATRPDDASREAAATAGVPAAAAA